MSQQPLRVLVVDDSVLYRKIITELLSAIPGVEVVGTAVNGEVALTKIEQLAPDLVTLDVEMPVMDGLMTLRQLRAQGKDEVVVVMVSAFTKEGASVTVEALNLGAYDFITKPNEADPDKNRELLSLQFRPLLNNLITKRILRQTIRTFGAKSGAEVVPASGTRLPPAPASQRVEVIAIGISTGGPNALAELLPRLPATIRVPILIVQHMPKLFTGALADSLNSKSAIRVVEGQNDQQLAAGTAYIAPGGQQMKVIVKKNQPGYYLEINNDPPENHCLPSADYLFRSVAKVYQAHALGVIMTGMGADGTLGLRLMKRQGAQVIAQDEASCVVYGMPFEAYKAGVTDVVCPLTDIADEIVKRLR